MIFLILLIYGDEYLIDMPNNKIIPFSSYGIEIKIWQDFSLVRLSVSPFNNFSFGISGSVENILGSGEVKFYFPYVQLKFIGTYRQINYGLGYDNNKFSTIGTYGILGYNFFNKIILCGGLNYYNELKLFGGAEIGILSRIIGIVELYDEIINLGVRWALSDELFFNFNFNAVNKNVTRNIKLSYINYI